VSTGSFTFELEVNRTATIMVAVFFDVMPCSLGEDSSETSVKIYQTARYHVPDKCYIRHCSAWTQLLTSSVYSIL
jgi:hypothetical protein